MVDLVPEEKKEKGAVLSELKTKLTEAYEAKQQFFKLAQINQQLEKDLVDISLDTTTPHGSYSILAEIRRDAEEICKGM